MNSDNIRYSWTPCTEILFEKKNSKSTISVACKKEQWKKYIDDVSCFFLNPSVFNVL